MQITKTQEKCKEVKRLRVLLIAEACNPEAVSVPLVGWSLSRALDDLVDIHLVTESRTRDAVLRAGLKEGQDFTALDAQRVVRPVFHFGVLLRGGAGKKWATYTAKGWTIYTALSAISYRYFEHLVWREFGLRIQRGEFDVVHRVTPLTPTVPSLLASKCRKAKVPFVWGPINGGVPWPNGFASARWKDGEWLSLLRPLHKVLPGYSSTRRNAAAIIVASIDTWRQMPERYRHKCVYIPENGIDVSRFSLTRHQEVHFPLRVVFVGRLVRLKGADMLLEAAAPLIRARKVVVDIIGDGPEMLYLRGLVQRERIDQGVRFRGWVEHVRLHELLAVSDVFAFPSIKEFGGGVVLEAMAMGLPALVVGYAGPNELVSPRTGWRVPLGTKQQIIDRYREILARLCVDTSSIAVMGVNAKERVRRQFSWSAKARQVLQVYEWVVGIRAQKPDFGMPFPDEDGEPDVHG